MFTPSRALGLLLLPMAAVLLACDNDVAGIDTPLPTPTAGDTTSIAVDLAATRQSIDGFGGSTLPLVYGTEDYLGVYRDDALDAAFGQVGLTLGPLHVGLVEAPRDAANPWEARGNDNSDPFSINPDGFNFTGSDVILESLFEPARPYLEDNLSLGQIFDQRRIQEWMVPLRDEDYERYLDESAEHALAIMLHWREAYGIEPPLLHLFNEPTSGNRELWGGSTQEVVDIVKRVGERLTAAGFPDVKFVVPNEETIHHSRDVAAAILADPEARRYVGVIGYHPYPYGSVYSSPRRIMETSGVGTPDPTMKKQMMQLRDLSEQYDVPVWMTEVSEGPGNVDYPFTAIENVLARAIHIHDNFEYAGGSGYYGMYTVWDSRSHAEHFAGRNVPFLAEQSSVILPDVSTGEIHISGMGYAIGQYARWLSKGARWVDAESDNARVIVSAFRNPATNRAVLVIVNNDVSPQLLKVGLSGGSVGGRVTGEQSYADQRWAEVAAFSSASPQEVLFVAEARSVVTLAIPL